MEFKTGRFDDISLTDYHAMDGWSKSSLDKVHRSMAHYFASKEKKESSAAMEFGSAFHCAVLTPNLYQAEYVVTPDFGDLRTKAGKEARANFELANIGKRSISWDDAAKIEAMQKAVFDHPVAGQLFEHGDAEHSFFWIDEQSGLRCKVRPDYVRRDHKLIIDLKTTENASYFDFQRSIVKYRYHTQGAFFCDGVSIVENGPYEQFLLVAVETSAPYNVAIYALDKDALNVGRTSYRMDLNKIYAYEKSEDKWAGYTVQIQEMLLPAWVN